MTSEIQGKDNITLLVNAIQELSRAKTQEKVINIVKYAARHMIGAEGATFVMRDGDCCWYVDEDAISPLWKGQRFPMRICISGWVMLNNETVTIGDIFTDPRIPVDAYRPTFVRSLAMVPVRTESVIAAIGIYWSYKHNATCEEMEALQTLANATSIAMENIRMQNLLEDRVRDLEVANRAKDEFLLILSHEIRTPLNGIFGWANLLAEKVPSGIWNQDESNGIKTMEGCAEDLYRIIEDLFDMANILLGKLQIEPEPIFLDNMLTELLETIEPRAKSKSLHIERIIDPSIPQVLVDPQRIKQIFENVLSNAIKFTPENGLVKVSLTLEGPSVKVAVVDNGLGIDPSFLPFVFDRFSQAESALSRKYGGIGLGLAITKALVEAHGGKISVMSDGLGKGACIEMWFPIKHLP